MTFDVMAVNAGLNEMQLVLRVILAPHLAGDYNQNGVVDAPDFVVWRTIDGTQEGYEQWRTHFGATAGGAAAVALSSTNAVPEPSTWLLLITALVWLRRGCWCVPES